MEEEGWGIMNGVKEGDEDGEITFAEGRGKTVMDYVLTDRRAWEKIEKMEVGDEETNHQSVSVWIGRRAGEKKKKKEGEYIEREV